MRRLPVLAALVAALLVPTAAQADSGLTASTLSLDLGNIPAGHAYWADPLAVTLTNNTANPITISTMGATAGLSWHSWQNPICVSGVTLAAGDSCDFVPIVAWNNNAPLYVGPTSGSYSITTTQGTTVIPVSAVWTAGIAVQPRNGDSWFPQVVGTATYTHTFWVKNTGNDTLTITNVQFGDPGTPPGFHLVSDGCTAEGSVAPGARCGIVVAFDGPSDWKVGTPSIVVTSDGLNTGLLEYDFTGVRFRSLQTRATSLSETQFEPKSLDGTRDGTRFSFRANHLCHVVVQVVNHAGNVVRSWRYAHLRTRGAITWRGKNNSGAFVRPGSYHFRVRLSRFGTHVYSGRTSVTVEPPT